MKKHLFFLLFLSSFFFSKDLYAWSFDKLYLNVGSHTEFYNATQINTSGDKNKLQFLPTLGAMIPFTLPYQFEFLPEFNWVLPINQGSNKIIKNIFMIRGDFGYLITDWFKLRSGTSLIIQNQHGRGGSTQIENGNSVSTFYYPEANRSSFNNTFDLGLEVFHQNWSARIQTYTYSLFKEQKREISYTLFITYLWDFKS
jgi:hypothetical protein